MRVNYVGELGWEIHAPMTGLPAIFDALMKTGEPLGLRLFGAYAMNSLRIEKAYRHWGDDIGDEDTPLEAGLGFAVKFDKPGGFIGRDALLKQKEAGLTRRLVQFKLSDPAPLLYHNEPILRDGEICGYVTSAMYGHSLGGAIGMGYVQNKDGVDADYVNSGSYEIEVACEGFKAEASLRPMYDPKGERMKA